MDSVNLAGQDRSVGFFCMQQSGTFSINSIE